MSKISAIVFIKADSERLPGKNTRLFNGKPLYSIILNRLSGVKEIQEILVNSDSEEVLDFAFSKLNKGIPIYRPDYLKGVTVSANDLIAHDIQFSGNEHFFQTHCTNPLLTEATIARVIEKYFSSLPKYDSLFSATKIQNRFFKSDGTPLNHAKGELLRLQDLSPMYMENASFFIFSKSSFLKSGNDRIGLAPQLYEISLMEGVDIDYENDFLLAELLERNKKQFPDVFKDIS